MCPNLSVMFEMTKLIVCHSNEYEKSAVWRVGVFEIALTLFLMLPHLLIVCHFK